MAAINFPDSPAVNDLFTYNSVTYRWDGIKWKAVSNINNILPTQSGNTNKFLKTNGTDPLWDEVYPSQTGNSGKFLKTNGTSPAWEEAYPSQTGNAGKFLQTDGTSPTWTTVFPAGTRLVFAQTNAPLGWTKDTTHNNKAMRVVSGTAGSGGSVDFTTAFASKAVTGSVGQTGETTLATSQIPSHAHSFSIPVYNSGWAAIAGQGSTYTTGSTTGYTGGGGSHSHSGGSFSGTAIDLTVKYVDVIIATKD